MKKVIFLFLVLLIIGCNKQSNNQVSPTGECSVDSDCVASGCSGTVCQSKDAPPVFTTCIYLPEFDCYKTIQCACIEGNCTWDKTVEFDECVNEARQSNTEVIT
jgi:eight-cysteine-cluster-containing protein